MRTASEQLADWIVTVELKDVPPHVQHSAKRHLLDGIGAALAARRTGAARAALSVAQGLGGPPEAAIIGGSKRVGAASAAFADGVLVHALDFDDTHAEALIHASAIVLPAALSVGQQVGASGADVLSAALAGYEVGCRVGAASSFGFHARGLHATGVCGPLAAAAVTARLLRLPADEVANALGIAGSSSAGLLEFLATGASTKQTHPGSASLAGVIAARLAAEGAQGPRSVLEGSKGLYAALSGRDYDIGRLLHGLGADWETALITLKPYPACQLMHAALDAGVELRQALLDRASGVLPPGLVDGLEVHIHPDSAAIVSEPAADKVAPRTPYDAKFSLPWSLAALLIDGSLAIGTYTERSISRPDVVSLAGRIRTVTSHSPAPAAAAPAVLRAALADGRTVEVAVPTSSGGPGRPLNDAAVVAKFVGNTGGDPAAARELAEQVLALEHLDGITTLMVAAAAAAREELMDA